VLGYISFLRRAGQAHRRKLLYSLIFSSKNPKQLSIAEFEERKSEERNIHKVR